MQWMGDVMSRDGMNGRKRPDECLVRSLPASTRQWTFCSRSNQKSEGKYEEISNNVTKMVNKKPIESFFNYSNPVWLLV
jgi:hypothetical protein